MFASGALLTVDECFSTCDRRLLVQSVWKQLLIGPYSINKQLFKIIMNIIQIGQLAATAGKIIVSHSINMLIFLTISVNAIAVTL